MAIRNLSRADEYGYRCADTTNSAAIAVITRSKSPAAALVVGDRAGAAGPHKCAYHMPRHAGMGA